MWWQFYENEGFQFKSLTLLIVYRFDFSRTHLIRNPFYHNMKTIKNPKKTGKNCGMQFSISDRTSLYEHFLVSVFETEIAMSCYIHYHNILNLFPSKSLKINKNSSPSYNMFHIFFNHGVFSFSDIIVKCSLF